VVVQQTLSRLLTDLPSKEYEVRL